MNYNLERIKEIFETEQNITNTAKKYAEENNIDYTDSLRRKFSNFINGKNKTKNIIDIDLDIETSTKTNQYKNDIDKSWKGFNAIAEDGSMMSIEQYCSFYGLDITKVKSWKLVTHTAVPFYNVAFYDTVIESELDIKEIQKIISEELSKTVIDNKTSVGSGIGIVKISDLHCGAYIDNLIRTKEFSINILAEKLRDAADQINKRGYEKVHIHLLGDLIESFTGLSHKNTWKGLDKAMVGAEVVKLTTTILHKDFLNRINNLQDIKIIAGNHDRVTSDNKEDVQGDAANLIAWGLELMGYKVEFNPLVLTHIVDGICHILTHGHHGISKKSTKQLCWDYGEQGMFNLICEGHLHSIIQKLSVTARDKYQTVKDDAVDHRRMNCPSFFTGNFYSESLGYTSESGFVIVENNGKGVPNVFYYAV